MIPQRTSATVVDVMTICRARQSSRREFLAALLSGAALQPLLQLDTRAYGQAPSSATANAPPAMPQTTTQVTQVKALTFDVFGTVVDWRSSIIREGERLATAKGLKVDWAKFADAWRAGYGPAMDRVRKGDLPWTTIDALHRMTLDRLLDEFAVRRLTETEIEHFNRAWHRLQPWPDAVAGLTRLRKKYILATLSNGNVALLVNMAKNAGLPWDAVLSSELAGHYKPDKEVYQKAAELLGLKPNQVMMVAAHEGDLRAAASVGFKTAFVPRPLEYGPNSKPDLTPDPACDIVAEDFVVLAQKLGA